jgi:hypothetical protein
VEETGARLMATRQIAPNAFVRARTMRGLGHVFDIGD